MKIRVYNTYLFSCSCNKVISERIHLPEGITLYFQNIFGQVIAYLFKRKERIGKFQFLFTQLKCKGECIVWADGFYGSFHIPVGKQQIK